MPAFFPNSFSRPGKRARTGPPHLGPGAGCAPVLLLSCGLLIGELGVSLADLVRLGLLGLVPALGLGQLEQLGLGVVPLVEQAEEGVPQGDVDALRGVGVILEVIFFSLHRKSVIRS